MAKKRVLATVSPTRNTKKHQPTTKKRKTNKASPTTSDAASPPSDQPDSDAPSISHDGVSLATPLLSSSACAEPSYSSVSADESSSTSADIPCIECARMPFQECDDGVIRPNYCVFDHPNEECMRCIENNEICQLLPQPFRSIYGRLMAMTPDFKALVAGKDFAMELKNARDASYRENEVVTQLKVLNRNLLRLLNDRRESMSKDPLGDENLLGWTRVWEDSEKELEHKYGL
ncbi:hypothetical protein BJY00DRAFT_308098 [Aspergillus carlsbadensis]|nr:hypothetical protein BJY00DRAFT_308098 [Aspergillus carlsbadensis]